MAIRGAGDAADRQVTGRRRAACALVAAAAVLWLAACREGERSEVSGDFLVRAWEAYKDGYIHPDGYVLDRARGSEGEVTSEGQGYALLRAVWMRDEPSFRRVLNWTEQHLQRPDGLFSWQWSAAGGGQVLDRNTATDADQEIAFALIMASVTFDDPELRTRARAVLRGIREHAALPLADGWFPAAGNWAVEERITNLSYFLPYAYAYFERIDPDGRWNVVSEVGYDLLRAAMEPGGVRLPPDFVILTPDGALATLTRGAINSDFSSDAMRIPWRIAADCALHSNVRACADPLAVGHITALLARDGRLFTRYTTTGEPLERTESYSFYGAVLPYLQQFAPPAAQAVAARKLNDDALDALVRDDRRYYDANWVWFGIAAARGLLAERTPPPGTVPLQ